MQQQDFENPYFRYFFLVAFTAIIPGTTDADSLIGSAMNDSPISCLGNDILSGCTGRVILPGGDEAAIFVFAKGNSSLNAAADQSVDLQQNVEYLPLHGQFLNGRNMGTFGFTGINQASWA